jgi:hypothetical protein
MSEPSANKHLPIFRIHQSAFCGYHKDLATASQHKVALQEKTMRYGPGGACEYSRTVEASGIFAHAYPWIRRGNVMKGKRLMLRVLVAGGLAAGTLMAGEVTPALDRFLTSPDFWNDSAADFMLAQTPL